MKRAWPVWLALSGCALADTHEDLNRIFARPEFAWKHEAPAQTPGWLLALVKLWRWFAKLFEHPQGATSLGLPDMSWLGFLVRLLLIVALVGLILLALRKLWQLHAARPALAQQQTFALEEDPSVLPSWQVLERQAQEAFNRGEMRLAMRGLYLGVLSALETHGHLSYARGTTNAEYLRQVHAHGGPAGAFRGVTQDFDRVWYGHHSVDADGFRSYQAICQELLR
ncbi:MAG: DUF4129 domain-containing protein [Candidatus Xenobia bacterium]